jgi:hypothetical protein
MNMKRYPSALLCDREAVRLAPDIRAHQVVLDMATRKRTRKLARCGCGRWSSELAAGSRGEKPVPYPRICGRNGDCQAHEVRIAPNLKHGHVAMKPSIRSLFLVVFSLLLVSSAFGVYDPRLGDGYRAIRLGRKAGSICMRIAGMIR